MDLNSIPRRSQSLSLTLRESILMRSKELTIALNKLKDRSHIDSKLKHRPISRSTYKLCDRLWRISISIIKMSRFNFNSNSKLFKETNHSQVQMLDWISKESSSNNCNNNSSSIIMSKRRSTITIMKINKITSIKRRKKKRNIIKSWEKITWMRLTMKTNTLKTKKTLSTKREAS